MDRLTFIVVNFDHLMSFADDHINKDYDDFDETEITQAYVYCAYSKWPEFVKHVRLIERDHLLEKIDYLNGCVKSIKNGQCFDDESIDSYQKRIQSTKTKLEEAERSLALSVDDLGPELEKINTNASIIIFHIF
jgi:hypothetical protein